MTEIIEIIIRIFSFLIGVFLGHFLMLVIIYKFCKKNEENKFDD